jgi:regulator of cell morphogenesis and NO signaling
VTEIVHHREEKIMTISSERTVRELALGVPNATRIFEKLGIDYCCGGSRSLNDACRVANLQVAQVLEDLENASLPVATVEPDWQGGMLAELVEHIKQTHHQYTREEIARLQPLLDKVCKAHGEHHPELLVIRKTFAGLAAELTTHLMKEEMVLFPYVVRAEQAALRNAPAISAPFGKVENPVRAMMQEHDSAGIALRSLREASHGYTTPADGCLSYRTLYEALAAFEADLHQHIHLENNILFPRAIALVNAASKASA